jgi:polar amino acid transport system substrate-binding protein
MAGLSSLAISLTLSGAAGKPLRIGIAPTFPPMVFKQHDRYAGLEIDLATALGEALQRPINFVELRPNDQIPGLLAGRVDLLMSSVTVSLARRTQVEFSRPYLKMGQMAMARKENAAAYRERLPADLPGPVGTIKGSAGDFLVQQEFPGFRRREFKSGEDASEALRRRKIELFVGDGPLVSWLAGARQNKELVALPYLLSEEQLAWAMRKEDTQLHRQVNDFLGRLERTGRLTAMVQRWIPLAQ